LGLLTMPSVHAHLGNPKQRVEHPFGTLIPRTDGPSPTTDQSGNPAPQLPQLPLTDEVNDYLNGKGVGPYPIPADPTLPPGTPGLINAIPPTSVFLPLFK
jgi:hypothetical protein